MFVNDTWCNSGYSAIKEQCFCRDIELLAVSMRPYYLLREFSQAILITVYILSTAKVDAACDTVHFVTCRCRILKPSCSSLMTSIMPRSLQLYPHSSSTSKAAPEPIKHWTNFMPTLSRHTTQYDFLPWDNLIRTWLISSLLTYPC